MSGGTGRVALTIVGQVAGAYLGGPIGAAIGGALGGLAGNALFPLDPAFGPRIGDLSLQASSYGISIPIVYRASRVAGNVFWKTILRERAREEDQGGKGGPQQSFTSFTYDADFAIGICEGEMSEVLRIWADGRLVYDMTDPTNIAAVQASGNLAAHFTFYPGSETQLPDPTMEATEGVGNVPGYRGTCYVVFRTLELSDYGNRIPSFSFEVIEDAPGGSPAKLLDVDLGLPLYRHLGIIPQNIEPIPTISSINGTLRVMNNADMLVRIYEMDGTPIGTDFRTPFEEQIFGVDDNIGTGVGWWLGSLWMSYITGHNTTFLAGAKIEARALTEAGDVTIDELQQSLPQSEVLMGFAAGADRMHFIVFTGSTPSSAVLNWYLMRFTGSAATLERSGTVDQTLSPGFDTFGLSPISQTNGMEQASMLESDLQTVWNYQGSSQLFVWTIGPDDVMRRTINFNDAAGAPMESPWYGIAKLSIYADDGLAYLVGASASHPDFSIAYPPLGHGATIFNIYTRFSSGPPGTMTIGEIVNRICRRAGLTALQLDTASLTELCDGYTISRASTARSAIEVLAGPFTFAGVESESKLRFASRGGASVATLEEDDLGATSGTETRELILSERTQETELPSRVTLRYIANQASYQQGAQSARRVTTGSVQVIESELAVCMTDDRAAQATDMLMRESWISRNKRMFATTRKWTALEPNDVITIPLTTATYTVRIVGKRESAGLIEWDSVDHDVAVYSSEAVGGTIPTPGTGTVPIISPTRMVLMDTAMLRDVDDDPGIYSAVAPFASSLTWTGAIIERADAPTAIYSTVATTDRTATIGRATTVLANWTGGNRYDIGSSVDIELSSGTVASVTDAQLLSFANLAWMGGELLQFRNATVIGTNQYRLTTFLRARKGTDHALSTHAVNEPFVLLTDTTIARVPLSLDRVDSTNYYRATSFRSLPDPLNYQAHTHVGAAITPLPPVQITGTRLANDDIVIRWIRRARIGQQWRDSVDVPLDETTEAYELDIWNAGNTAIVRSVTGLTTVTTTYTSAQQTTDFGGLATTLNLRVYQISDRVGRGYPGTVALSVP